MKRSFFQLVFGIILSGLLVPGLVHAEEIFRFEETVVINADSSLNIAEKILYDFGDSQRHGIFRTIPVHKTNQDGKKFILDLTDISVTDQTAKKYPYERTFSQGEMTLKIGDPDKTVTGAHAYNISYSVTGALTYFSDHDELYWNVTGNGWQVPIRYATAHIILPSDTARPDLKVSCFSGAMGSTDTDCNFSYDDKARTVTIQAQQLNPYEGLTVVVGFPRGMVTVQEPKEYVPFWETVWGKTLIALIIFIAFLWYIVAPLILPFLWWKNGRDPMPPVGQATAWFEPPKTKKGRKLTPGETGTLVDEHADNKDITATMIDLARRGYIHITEKTKGDIHLKEIASSVPDDHLERFERTILTGIFKGSDSVRLKTAKLVTVATNAKNELYDAVVSEGFFPKNPQHIRNGFSVASVFALMTGNFLLFLSVLFFGFHMPKKTLAGAGAAAMARALKNFITSQERQYKFQAEKQILFEKMLPFAVAFGVEKIWAARFADMHLTSPDWYTGYSGSRFNSVMLADSLSRTSSSIARAATPTSSSSGFSSGFSGGSSGGGGGGGGGGSW